MSNPLNNAEQEELIFSDMPMDGDMEVPELEEVPNGFQQGGQYVALVDWNEFLGSEPIDNPLPSAEVVLPRNRSFYNIQPQLEDPSTSFQPISINVGGSMVELPSGSREETSSPGLHESSRKKPMAKELVKRRLHRQIVEQQASEAFDMARMMEELKKLENYQLPLLMAEELSKTTQNDEGKAEFATELMISTLTKLLEKK